MAGPSSEQQSWQNPYVPANTHDDFPGNRLQVLTIRAFGAKVRDLVPSTDMAQQAPPPRPSTIVSQGFKISSPFPLQPLDIVVWEFGMSISLIAGLFGHI